MKYKVITWTYFDDETFPEGPPSLAAENAIIDDIKEHGYNFTGWHHQEALDCVPVLNDGTKQTYSQRGWGRVMAEAHGYTGRMDYARFAFLYSDDDETVLPKCKYDSADIRFREDLCETYEVAVDDNVLNDIKGSLMFSTYDLGVFRYVDVDDTITFLCADVKESYFVSQVDKELDVTDEEMDIIQYGHFSTDDNLKKQADELYENAKRVLRIKLSTAR